MEVLQSLWSVVDLDSLKCCQCNQPFTPTSVLARTFTLKSLASSHSLMPTTQIDVPGLSDTVLIYHRDLKCLLECTKYVAVSHMWHPAVADLERKREGISEFIGDPAQFILEEAARIYRGITDKVKNRTVTLELWYDYLSVPQWEPALKSNIIPTISKIFKNAEFTVIHLSDINVESVDAMRMGSSSLERCRGISNVCNAKYFSRVWTAMELTQSRKIRVMLQDYTLLEACGINGSIVNELEELWEVEIQKHNGPHMIEDMVSMGNNLVPWQLGPLEVVRTRSLDGHKIGYANAYEFLSRRCLTHPRDFFHALLGIVKPGISELELCRDDQGAMMQIARICLENGDFSPLLMIPAWAQRESDESILQNFGYMDLGIFAIGAEEQGPERSEVKYLSNNPLIKAEEIGIVRSVRMMNWASKGHWKSFSVTLKLVLETTGLEIGKFVNTFARLYGQKPENIDHRLSMHGRLSRLQEKLAIMYDSFPNIPHYHENWVADAMGLSNTSLESPIGNPISPMRYLDYHGGTLHLGNAGSLIKVQCTTCKEDFLIRVAVLTPPSHILGSKAYRIPGLKYEHSLASGTGFRVKDKIIVGRFIWAIPTCNCKILKDLEVKLDDMPMPHPNQYVYGEDRGRPWQPVRLEERLTLSTPKPSQPFAVSISSTVG